MNAAASVLHPAVHAKLLDDLPGVCARANIPIEAIKTSAMGVLAPKELAWLHSLAKRPGRVDGRGLMLIGGDGEDKLIAICAALLRNFIDARVISLNSLLDGGFGMPSVVLIPNLYIKSSTVLPSWKVQQLYDILMSRKAGALLTVGYIEDLATLKKDYGAVFERHIKNNYDTIPG